MGGDEGELGPERQAALHSLLASLPAEYAARYAALQNIRHAFHQAIAKTLEPVFNEHIVGKPQDSIEERQNLASWVNEQLRNLGLAVKCPVTKRPAVLIVDRQDRDHPEITRFRFGVRDENGKYSNKASRQNLGELELTEHSPRIEARARLYRIKHRNGPQR